MDEENVLDFNFWPSYADLMLSLVLILILVLFLITAVTVVGTVNLTEVERNQKQMVRAIAYRYDNAAIEREKGVYVISMTGGNTDHIKIRIKPMLQEITFTDHVLFRPDRDELNPRGEDLLRTVGEALKQDLSAIEQIQIQGHADPDSTTHFPSNSHLAALRAIRVLKFLQDTVGIDPAEHLMSATSFGEFKPVQRSVDDDRYNRKKLQEHNSTPELKGRNRRIELLLFYRR